MTINSGDNSSQPKSGAARSLFLGLAFGMLSALGPFAIDLYLPAMPTMARAMGVDSGAVQRSLSAFFLGLAIAQIPLGWLGDRFGRRKPLIGGLALFAAASLGCALARDIDQLVALRFLQGMGACAGTSSVRAMIRDKHSGHHAARLMAFTFLIIGISPVLAPLAGSYLLRATSWQGLFVILASAGVTAVLVVTLFLPETLPPARRVASQSILQASAYLLAKPTFVAWAFVAGMATTIPFAFVTAAPFLFSQGYGLTPHQYSLLLALNAIVSIVATQFAPYLMRRLGVLRLVTIVVIIATVATGIIALAATTTTHMPLALLQGYSMLIFAVS
ncbi:multidrug effflux MFS transporter [Rhizorhapis suberifaciens]|uniref:Bcr/CflA family efflux transporter n=1 Tax=Rhizorhapis suberifaciens TaxID=13656 RepID=A0A840HTY4_9SPHN|nr:multidrug effflux MFS transporter [Rhizorhapis suberifaciens]MBB4641161.1 DHA1 family bicyclomycin/chloramphenicol resistance-like MFS transporter [Rhizorhapis suberifaciens]